MRQRYVPALHRWVHNSIRYWSSRSPEKSRYSMYRNFPLLLLLFFLSGASALVYELLWMKELGLLFGNASYAMATTLAAFFLGLAVGGYHWGSRVSWHDRPLQLYGILELCVAICAAGYFLILAGYAWLYPYLFTLFGDSRVLFIAVKFLLSMVILFPPAYFMGGTLPVISQAAVSRVEQVGTKVSLLYAVNTLGAVVGVFLAGFVLPPLLGFSGSYLAVMGVNTLLGVIAIMVARKQPRPVNAKTESGKTARGFLSLQVLAFLSGMAMLALQVLWGRMFAQVLQNSVYTFAIVLMMYLFSMALGGMLANRLMYLRLDPVSVMFILLLGGALLVALTPFEFIWLSDNLHYIGGNEDWHGYVMQIMLDAFLLMGPALLLLGSVFPFLLKLSEKSGLIAGKAVGQLVAINTAGAISGSLLAGFVLLDFLGLWSGIRLMAVMYVLAAWLWLERSRRHDARAAYIPAAMILLLVSLLDTSKLPAVRVDPVIDEESLLQVWEGSAATVAVIRRGAHLKIKVDNYYTLGGTGSYQLERFQGRLPILLHANPEAVYVLGLGTGISAGAALSLPIDTLLVTELLPEVIEASDKYFARYNNDLFYDPRARVISEDGRNYLRGTRESYDVIISDLFVPWKAGTGNLYSLEHYQEVFQHLDKDGLFMQWLPAYQLSRPELSIIMRTMQEVFPQITVWRGDFSALKPIIGLLGHKNKTPLSRQAGLFRQRDSVQGVPLLAYYAGSLGPLHEQLSKFPANTDNHPVIEFLSPITQRRIKAEKQHWLAGDELIALLGSLLEKDDHFFLSAVPESMRNLPAAGYHLHFAQLLKQQGRLNRAEKEMAMYQEEIAASTPP